MCQTKCQCLHKKDLEFLLEQTEASNDKHTYSERPSCRCDLPRNKVRKGSKEIYSFFDLTFIPVYFPMLSLDYRSVAGRAMERNLNSIVKMIISEQNAIGSIFKNIIS